MSPLLVLFIRKGLTEKKRHIFRNIVNSTVTILFVIAVVHILQSQNASSAVQNWKSGSIDQDELADNFPGEHINKVYYTPRTEMTENIMESVRQTLYIVDERLEPFESESELEFALLDNEYICFGVSFHNVSEEGVLVYTIRTKNNNFQTDTIYSRDVFFSYKKRDNEYIESGFLALQNAIDQAFVMHITSIRQQGIAKTPRVTIRYDHIPVKEKQGPQEPSKINLVIAVLAVGFTIMNTYILLLPLVEERANGMKEYLKIATSASYWNEGALFMINFVQFSLVLLVCLAITIFSGVWETNPAQLIYLFVLGFEFITNHVAFTFFLSTTLASSTIATAVAPVTVFVPLIFSGLSKQLILPLCIFPVNGLYYGGKIFDSFKSSGHLFRAGDLFTIGYPGIDQISLFRLYVVQLHGAVLWVFLWFYVSNVFPGQYGTPKPKNFFLSQSYWKTVKSSARSRTKSKNKINAESQHELQHDSANSNDMVNGFESISLENIDQAPEETQGVISQHVEETPNRDSRRVVRISKLNKVFNGRSGRAKVAVKDFSLSIYNHSITVLLGHNGAGKTTTMNIITGILPRSSGSIIVDGECNPNQYRQKIGFCPQHDVFFSYLNCREHLEFFGRLRGLNNAEAREEARLVLAKVNMLNKSESLVHTLSGGMKRRLSLANAIIGHTKLLILDEPTSGLDPESRRDIWDVLLKLRQNHTILLTTHFMEEADVLGDWVAIMEEGQLVAFGSPLYLKHHYGKGYTLKLLKSSNFAQNKTWELIRQHVPHVIMRDSVQEVFAVTLPYDEMTEYPSLLKELELGQQDLGIESIGIANATLEEVFLNSSNQKIQLEHHPESVDYVDNPIVLHNVDSPTSISSTKKGFKMTPMQIKNICLAIWRKKWIHMKSNKHIYGWLLALPLIVTALCFTFTNGIADAATALPAVVLKADNIKKPLGILVINMAAEDYLFQTFNKDTERMWINGVELILYENVSLFGLPLRELIDKDYIEYRDRLVIALECNITRDDVEMLVLYNNNLVHSTGIAESIATTILLRYHSGLSEALVEVQNIPSTRKQLIDIQTPYFFTELVSIAFMFYILIYLQVPLQEHLTGFRQLQNINRYVYWISTYTFDLIIHFTICSLVIALVVLIDREDAFSTSSCRHIFLILVLYGMLALLVVYIISQCVANTNTAITIMSYLMIVGVGGVFLLSSEYDNIKNNAVWIGMMHIVPEFALKHSMRVVYENQKLMLYEHLASQQHAGSHSKAHELLKDRIYPSIFYATFMIIFLVLVVVLNEGVENIYMMEKVKQSRELAGENIRKVYRQVSRTISRKDERPKVEQDPERRGQDEIDSPGPFDDDVDKESEMVKKLLDSANASQQEYAIVVKGLKKNYTNHEAVKCVSFAVKKGECFGLLGMNGAGKTTLFQMLSGNLPLSDGKVYLQQCEVHDANAFEYRRQYGYCPQLDVLLDFMTVYEVIDYFAQLKSLSSRESLIMNWLAKLDIQQYKNHALRECSGGTKRKVNTILALLGGPSVVLLDEPTTGVDPKSRHFLWKTIKIIQRKNQTILLTSHSMDECEELCNRLSIMVDGRLSCIGTIPQLKKRYGQGYIFLLKLNNTPASNEHDVAFDNQQLILEVKERFKASLQEEHKGLLKFVVSLSVKLSNLFDLAIALKEKHGEHIVNYSISESSLEDIFLNFQPKKISISEQQHFIH
ncbi:phospholipid-transporting ATPase ABCA1 [Anopheles nili]|uniref:phospholipid-transporting ATPase ABCA1 n=1 Tax=Anopheles nili TaxID=185578 RepID=UPI00237B8C3B|nr:phospholipid-transporting ATPase ABCA1 [Anopheles nili]